MPWDTILDDDIRERVMELREEGYDSDRIHGIVLREFPKVVDQVDSHEELARCISQCRER